MARTMKQLSGLDATFLHLETADMPMHVGALHVFEIPPGQTGKFVTRLRAHIASRLSAAPMLRRRLWWMPLNLANPAWVDADPDLRVHIVEIKLPPSGKLGDGMPALEALVSERHSVLLDRKRPLWKMHVLEGLAPAANGNKRVGLYTQLHHAAVDGQAAVALAQVILDLQPEGRALVPPPSPRQKVFTLGWSEMLRGAIGNEVQQVVQIVKQLPGTVGALAGAAGQALQHSALLSGKDKASGNLTLAPRTLLNVSVGPGRAFAAISLPLVRLKAMAKTHDATLNDMVLCSTALRRWLGQHGGVPRKSLVAAVPISLRAKGDTRSDTQASMTLVSLGTQLGDLRQRIAHIRHAATAMKATVGKLKSALPTDFPSIGVPWLLEALTALYGKARVADRIPLVANLVISNVPGPPVPLYMAGARMMSNFPTSIVAHGLGLNITVQSYDQQMDFGLMADAAAMPDVRTLADALRVAYDDLCLLDAELNAPPTLADTGRAVADQAGRRIKDGLGSVGNMVGGMVGGMVGNVVQRTVQGAVRGALQAGKPAKSAAAIKPAPAGAAASKAALAKPARKRRLTIGK